MFNAKCSMLNATNAMNAMNAKLNAMNAKLNAMNAKMANLAISGRLVQAWAMFLLLLFSASSALSA
jgi:hypothetical protein